MRKKKFKPVRNGLLKGDLLIDTTFDPHNFLLDSPFNTQMGIRRTSCNRACIYGT